MKYKCNLCSFIAEEDDQQTRMDRHVEGRHTKHTTISERDGLPTHGHGMGNLIIGNVEWKEVR